MFRGVKSCPNTKIQIIVITNIKIPPINVPRILAFIPCSNIGWIFLMSISENRRRTKTIKIPLF